MAFDDAAFWHLISGTRGGPNRLQILLELSRRPYNANQLSELLALDYKTTKRHLELLLQASLVQISEEPKYGELYFITDYAKEKIKDFEKSLEKIRKW
ncbi:winged helix-turn-helix transcriptional regulator [Candidatus Micrarchaeota archaeon]|nr:winged helix-turn-helix transcriptional regulator [Candidatus Micrarchaeota archaeon]